MKPIMFNTIKNIYGDKTYLYQAINNIECLCCLDSQKQWDWKPNELFEPLSEEAVAARGLAHWQAEQENKKRDNNRIKAERTGKRERVILYCNGCSHQSNVVLKSTFDLTSIEKKDGRLYYKMNDTSEIPRRMKELEKFAKQIKKGVDKSNKVLNDKLHTRWENNPNPLWERCIRNTLYKKTEILDISIAIQELANKAFSTIQIMNGNLFELANLVKNFTLNFNFENMTSENSEKHVIHDSPDKWSNSKYIVFEYNKKDTKEKKICGIPGCGFKYNMVSLSIRYLILEPRNGAARNECNNFMNEEISVIMNKKYEINAAA